jgi:UDP-N-acetylmuramoylalanine--D-glutamate ligase
LQEAAAKIRQLGGEVELGGHSAERLAACDLLVLSPGVPPNAPVLMNPAVRAVRRVSELEYAWRALAAPVVAVTGTNGKSTTSALTAHLLRAASFDAPAAGNIGLALSEVALRPTPPDWVVVECSSFQLADVETFAPTVGVVTNLAPDHLDRYESVSAYYADKARLFAHASQDNTWILNGEDATVLALPGSAPGVRWTFRTDRPLAEDERGAWIDAAGRITVRFDHTARPLVSTAELRILGRHNHANALAAAAAATAAGADADAVAEGLRTFGGLEHRLEVVAERAGVLWINDSKATNVASTRVALRSFERPIVLLLGGRPKGESFAALLADMTAVRIVIAFGEAGRTIVHELGSNVSVQHENGAFTDVVERARKLAQPGDVILLSPACASFDMFRDYEDRGRQFKELAMSGGEAAHG